MNRQGNRRAWLDRGWKSDSIHADQPALNQSNNSPPICAGAIPISGQNPLRHLAADVRQAEIPAAIRVKIVLQWPSRLPIKSATLPDLLQDHQLRSLRRGFHAHLTVHGLKFHRAFISVSLSWCGECRRDLLLNHRLISLGSQFSKFCLELSPAP